MKRIAIYGACDRGLQIKRIIENQICDEIEIVNFIDKDNEKIHRKFDDIQIISLEEFLENLHNKSIDKVIISTNEIYHMEIVRKLSNITIENILVVNKDIFNIIEDTKKYKIEEIFETIKPTLNYLEFHVTDDCNLNCKGCGHFANLAPKDSVCNIEQFRKDIKRLSELFHNILTIRILGGEPLLNKDLDKFIVATRMAFPRTDLHIVTNGILIPKMNDNLIKVIKENRVLIDISWYKPTVKVKDKIKEFFFVNELYFNETSVCKIDQFSKQLTLSDKNNKFASAQECIANECYFLEKGFVSKCATPFLIKYLKESFKIETFNNDSIRKSLINIYDERINGFDIFNFLDNPSEFCKYCSKLHEYYGWEIRNINEAKLEDWLIY